MRIIFLLEERSMKDLLERLLPRILPDDVSFQLLPHEGKSDLQKSIPRKLRAWREPDVRFIIIHDQDSADCIALKKQLQELCVGTGKKPLIRIACHELEAWYFGDLKAVSMAYGKELTSLSNKSKYRNPDQIENAKEELRKLIPEHEQIAGARRIAPFMDLNNNRSNSFMVLIDGIRNLIR